MEWSAQRKHNGVLPCVCTTYIGTISKDPKIIIPLYLKAKRKTDSSERKHKIVNNDDYRLYSINGWTTATKMFSYLRWQSKRMWSRPFALIIDVHKIHRQPSVKKSTKINIRLIFFPSGSTWIFQPLDRNIFGIVKSKLKSRNFSKYILLIDFYFKCNLTILLRHILINAQKWAFLVY